MALIYSARLCGRGWEYVGECIDMNDDLKESVNGVIIE